MTFLINKGSKKKKIGTTKKKNLYDYEPVQKLCNFYHKFKDEKNMNYEVRKGGGWDPVWICHECVEDERQAAKKLLDIVCPDGAYHRK